MVSRAWQSTGKSWLVRWAWFILLVWVGGILTIGGYTACYQWLASRIRQEKYHDIAGIAAIKSDRIERYLHECQIQVTILAQSSAVLGVFEKPAHEPMGSDRDLAFLMQLQGYARLELLTMEGQVRYAKTGSSHLGRQLIPLLIQQALDVPVAFVSDLHGESPSTIHLDVVSAVRDEQGRPLGILLVSILASDELFPLIQSWPTPSPSAETLLVRRDGDEVLFLNNLRHRADTALKYRQPLSNVTLPATQAVLGKTGSFTGKDYRGVQVLADLRPIADTRWFLVTKIDDKEILTDLIPLARLVVVLIVLLLVGLVLAGAYLSKRREMIQHQASEAQKRRLLIELEQANRELKQFASIISHDLRSPLVNLQGFSSELSRSLEPILQATQKGWHTLDESQQQAVVRVCQTDIPESLAFIQKSVTHMDGYISALLKLTRMGHLTISSQRLDMNQLVAQTLEAYLHQIKEGHIQMTVQPLPGMWADPMLMKQVLANLLDNAIKYLSPDRPGRIEIRGWQTAKEVFLCLSDNGRGIANDDMDKVFAPFRRAGRRDVPGEGMGLAYVQAMIRRHGGRILFASQLDVGSQFAFSVPYHSQSGA